MSVFSNIKDLISSAGKIQSIPLLLERINLIKEQLDVAERENIFLEEKCKVLEKENEFMKNQIEKAKSWNKEKLRYELFEICPGFFVYKSKEEKRNHEPAHCICAHCFDNGEKGRIAEAKHPMFADIEYTCQRCGFIHVDKSRAATTIKTARSTYSVRGR